MEPPMKLARLCRTAVVGAALSFLPAALSAQMSPTPTGATIGFDTTNLDRSVRPQDDFYRFANGGWLEKARIPDDRSSYGSFVELSDSSQVAVRAIVEEAAGSSAPAGSIERKVGDFYASFMDSASVERLGLTPLRPEMDRIDRLATRGELAGLFAHLARQGVQTPFSLRVSPDGKNASRYVAYASQSGLGLPDRDYYSSQEPRLVAARDAYLLYAEKLLRLAGRSEPAVAAREVLALETALAKSQWDRTRNRDREATYNAFTVADLSQLTPEFSWTDFLTATDAMDTPIVVVRQPDYFSALSSLIATTPLETWKRYLTVKLLDSYADNLSSEFVDALFEYRGRTLQGLTEHRPRWKRGVDATQSALGMQIGQMYVDRHFRPEAKRRMDELVGNLLSAFQSGIDELEWMSEATRSEARDKLSKFTVKIAYPDEWPEHEGLEVRRGDLIGNVQRGRNFDFQEMVDELGKPIDPHDWAMTPQTVNAYYNSTENEIVFPAAILQPPFFDPAADDAVNYGAIGAVIGHEISHGFDDQGRRSDGEGNLRDWWTAADAQAFEQRADRLGLQYDAFTPLEGLSINGRLTMGENIGDLSGVAVAYAAYRRSLAGAEAPVIGGFTGDQRFFLGWAQIWRSLYRDEALRQRLLTDSHSPGEFRVNGVLRNLDAFHAAFGVESGDGMYLPPEERVEIW
jgi:predicted metalloendopeptidase